MVNPNSGARIILSICPPKLPEIFLILLIISLVSDESISISIEFIGSVYKFFKSIDKSNPRNLIKFNLGNEYAVDLFKQKKIKYIEILQLIKEITSLNIDSDVSNINNIIQYHEELKLYIKSHFV